MLTRLEAFVDLLQRDGDRRLKEGLAA